MKTNCNGKLHIYNFYLSNEASETEDILLVIFLFFLFSEIMIQTKVPEQARSITDAMRIKKIITFAVSLVILWRT